MPPSYTGQGNQRDCIPPVPPRGLKDLGFTALSVRTGGSHLQPRAGGEPQARQGTDRGRQEQGAAAPEPADEALSRRPSRPAPVQPGAREALATAQPGDPLAGLRGGHRGRRAARTGRASSPGAPGHCHRGHAPRARHCPPPNRDRRPPPCRTSPRPAPPLRGGRSRKAADVGPSRALPAGLEGALQPRHWPRGRRGALQGQGQGRVPGGGQRNKGASDTEHSGPGRPLGNPGPRPGLRQPGQRDTRALHSQAVTVPSQAAPAQQPSARQMANPGEFRDSVKGTRLR